MTCDFILAADPAKFGQPEIKLGIAPGMASLQRLTRAAGKAKAMEMCLTHVEQVYIKIAPLPALGAVLID